ncbi:MAG TPA: phosphatidylglycerol lysyltransferase domain-containing protein [Patescibacteria group bacterium]|nr:phosphatidylglycerol lysyltransferase domain-containing protein [Patescibacteria group bacterium]
MSFDQTFRQQLKIHPRFAVQFISLLVGSYGVYIIADSLLAQISAHRTSHLTTLLVDLPILVGISVIYLSNLLRRRKRTAWIVTSLAYIFYFGVGVSQLVSHSFEDMGWISILRSLIVPILIIGLLYLFRNEFIVKSDILGFRFALRFVIIVLTIMLIYGVAGFELMDTKDFHQEISWPSAFHYTIDQFNLTTNKPIMPHTKRAHLFVDSLSFVSLLSILYIGLSLFQPLKQRFTDQTFNREKAKMLLNEYHPVSEEYFKIWPRDKQFYFDDQSKSMLAYHVYRSVALVLSDPIGNESKFKQLLSGFQSLCFLNDWLPAMVHVSDKNLKLYEKNGFSNQLIGQEAIVDLSKFESIVKSNKYFRNISNKFNKQGYTFELLNPPHHDAILNRLKIISKEWLSKGGRTERGFAMGFFSNEYMQMCQIAVVRDAASTIQAFSNLVPAHFDKNEATYDLFRQSSSSQSNVNDFLLINLIGYLKGQKYKKLNMGLSPLAGIDEIEQDKQTIINNFLKFAYYNGDIFYSFEGLYKFKAKYEPDWRNKYVAYKNGLTGFSRTMSALTRCMTKLAKK